MYSCSAHALFSIFYIQCSCTLFSKPNFDFCLIIFVYSCSAHALFSTTFIQLQCSCTLVNKLCTAAVLVHSLEKFMYSCSALALLLNNLSTAAVPRHSFFEIIYVQLQCSCTLFQYIYIFTAAVLLHPFQYFMYTCSSDRCTLCSWFLMHQNPPFNYLY